MNKNKTTHCECSSSRNKINLLQAFFPNEEAYELKSIIRIFAAFFGSMTYCIAWFLYNLDNNIVFETSVDPLLNRDVWVLIPVYAVIYAILVGYSPNKNQKTTLVRMYLLGFSLPAATWAIINFTLGPQ
ncbi:hypothetical protein [Ruegeria sp.]|uniref:hypothetical protein n=1 Tax=Ruegeria sp. TaxID=1879320 RepID=UPI003B003065